MVAGVIRPANLGGTFRIWGSLEAIATEFFSSRSVRT
jgi:hypothetical protein